MRRRLILLAIGGSLALPACASTDGLRRDIVALRSESDRLGQEIQTHTATVGARQDDLYAKVAYRPLIAWSEAISARPQAERRITFRQTSVQGYIERRRTNCPWPLGDAGWYVEINSGNPTRGSVDIERFRLIPERDGLSLETPLKVRLETRFHWHLDVCVGGGFGGNVFVDAQKSFDARARLQFLPVADGMLPYTVDLTAPDSLGITAEVHLGALGTMGIPFRVDNMARRLAEGELPLAYASTGQIGPLPSGQSFTYQLSLGNTTFTPGLEGVEVASDVDVAILPNPQP